MIKKFSVFIIIVLIIILIGEIIYLNPSITANLFVNKESSKLVSNKNINDAGFNNKISSPDPYEAAASEMMPLLEAVFRNNISYDTLSILLAVPIVAKRNITKASSLTHEYEGKIVSIDVNASKQMWGDNKYQVDYQYKLELTAESDNKPTTFIYQEREAGILQIVELVDGQEKQIKFSDLKIGDTIYIRDAYDLKTEQYTRSKIMKI